MTYIPKSQIAIKSANPGEFKYKSSGESFKGPYIETSKGIRYAGTNNMNLGSTIIPVETPTNKEHGFSKDVIKFDIIKKSIKEFLSNTQPIPSMKRYPSKIDYTRGFFIRYFLRRINGMGYQEIDKEVYNGIIRKSKTYDYNLYEVGSIRWSLEGNVFKLNALALQELERKWKNISYLFPIFNEFAVNPFQNQENLYTEGGELYYGDSTEYIGAYHVHTTKGPMVGAYHTEIPHPKLYYIKELPTPANTSYEDFMEGYPPDIPPPFIPTTEVTNVSVDGTNIHIIGESYNCITTWGPPPPGFQGLTRNVDGLVPIGNSCINPGDGTGTYNLSTYGNMFIQACYAQCEGSFVDDTSGGAGCMVPWDSNYCSTCTINDVTYCNNTYGDGSYGYTGGMGGGGGRNIVGDCFIGETSIIMADETTKRIDEVIVGDIVKSEITTSNVIGIDIHKEKEYIIYSINNSEAFVTAEHPFKTTTGWKAIDPLETFKTHGIESNILEIGDILITKEGTEELKSINQSTKTEDTVYNLKLDNEHVYYANNYLVHNEKQIGTWSLKPEDIGNDLGAEICPCGILNGIMLYAYCCCDESC